MSKLLHATPLSPASPAIAREVRASLAGPVIVLPTTKSDVKNPRSDVGKRNGHHPNDYLDGAFLWLIDDESI